MRWKKMFKLMSAAVMAAVLIVVAGCSSQGNDNPGGESVISEQSQDSVVQTENAKLSSETENDNENSDYPEISWEEEIPEQSKESSVQTEETKPSSETENDNENSDYPEISWEEEISEQSKESSVQTEETKPSSESESNSEDSEQPEFSQEEKMQEQIMTMKIGDKSVEVLWEDNESTAALKELCKDTPLNIQMSMYGGFEQVGSLGTSLPRNDVQTTTQSGDIVLYSGDNIVVFYGSNFWSYTRLGRITGLSDAELAGMLGNGDVAITILVE